MLKIVIKKEPPEIDLSRPPPPSPTDDPLLLHGRLRPPRPPIPTNARETPQIGSSPDKPTSPLNRSALDFPLPGIPSDVEDNEDPSVPEQPVFNFAGAGDDPCSSSNEGESELEGEFTGKFRVVSVPTKADPPTSATRERIEQWGRPLSPFPRNVPAIPEDDAHSDVDLSLAQPVFLTEDHIPEANEDSPAKEQCDTVTEVHATTTLQDDLNSAPIDLDAIPSEVDGEEHTDEVFIEQTLSEEPQPSISPEPQTPAPQAALEERIEADEPMAEAADTDSESNCSDESDLSVVKIVSDDPWAAARAAAILKQVCSSSNPLPLSTYLYLTCSMIGTLSRKLPAAVVFHRAA